MHTALCDVVDDALLVPDSGDERWWWMRLAGLVPRISEQCLSLLAELAGQSDVHAQSASIALASHGRRIDPDISYSGKMGWLRRCGPAPRSLLEVA